LIALDINEFARTKVEGNKPTIKLVSSRFAESAFSKPPSEHSEQRGGSGA